MSDVPTDGLVVPMSVHAWMARNGILNHQLDPWWSPDTDSMIDPMNDPETRAAIRQLITALTRRCPDVEGAA